MFFFIFFVVILVINFCCYLVRIRGLKGEIGIYRDL